jgi:uncharacterized protein
MPVRAQLARNPHVTSSPATPPLDYERLRDALADAGAVVALAEVHGGVCGALCAGGATAAQRWLVDCLDDQELVTSTTALTRELADLVCASLHMLSDDNLTFEPLLPSDDAPLEEQVEALAQWCQGFLVGLGTTAPGIGREERDLAEILGDFAQISRAGLSEEEAAGGNHPDFSLAEIHEYVRVSVQMVFEELAARRSTPPRDTH